MRAGMAGYDTARKGDATAAAAEAALEAAARERSREIDARRGRRPKPVADDFANSATTTSRALQPPLTKGRNTEAEKYKLQKIFELKGGDALPQSALPAAVSGHLPLSLLQQHKK